MMNRSLLTSLNGMYCHLLVCWNNILCIDRSTMALPNYTLEHAELCLVFFYRTQSRYKTRDFDNVSVSSSTSGKLFELRTREHTPRFIDHHQYVGMINDVLKLRKNLCVCRHFHKLDKMAVTRYHEHSPF